MSETTEQPVSSTTAARARRGEGLSGMVLADLKVLAGQLGIKGTSGLRKGDLVSAIASHQSASAPAAPRRGSSVGAPPAEVNGPAPTPKTTIPSRLKKAAAPPPRRPGRVPGRALLSDKSAAT